ncbi:MAG TPA: response regulator [Gemmatimonadaceae bacterium]|nr:response regulator [Gemmatimonadaceae bacterium]
MTEPVKLLVWGIPAEILREIGLRLRGVVISEFDNAQQMGRAAAFGDARLVLLSDALPTVDSIYVARRAKDTSDDARIAFFISMQQAETALHALKDVHIDRFFLSPVDVEEMLRELAKMGGVEVLPPQASHGEHIAAAVFAAWDRARAPTFQKIDKLDDAAIALLDAGLFPDLKAGAQQDAKSIAELAVQFGFEKGAQIARDLAERFAGESLTPIDGVAISEQLLALRESLVGVPSPPAPQATATSRSKASTPNGAGAASEDSSLEGRKILIVDDEPMVSRGLTTLLGKRGMTVTAVNDPLRFWTVLDETKPNLILLDLEMPKISGTELCRAVRSDPRWSELPVIFLSGHTDQASVQRVFAAGADDYVGKPFVPAELMMRIESRLTGVKARRAPVETDPLTGLPIAHKATEQIDRFLRLARRKSDPYSIAVIQVDAFASLAKTFGRGTGDVVLRAIGELLPKSFRAEDVVGWWGGADFTIGMYGSTKEFSAIKLTQVCSKIGEQTFLSEDGQRVHVSCSGGVAQYQSDGDTVAALREEALKALEQVRAMGGTRTTGGTIRVGISGVKAMGPMTRRVDVAIVDDDTALVSLLQHAMESRSLRVATFGDGETAVAALTGAAPEVQASLILLGVDIPALNGLDVLRRLKAGEITRSSSVVMLTSRTGERDVLAALELGAADHIAKPFSVPVLMHKVRAMLKQSQA